MNTSLFTINGLRISRGQESSLHQQGKLALGCLLASREFLVLFELKLADVVAFRRTRDGLRIVCGEHDTKSKTVVPNVRRDFPNGCSSLVILVPDESARAAARRLMRREFPAAILNRVGIITYGTCRRLLARLPDSAIPSNISTAVAHLSAAAQKPKKTAVKKTE